LKSLFFLLTFYTLPNIRFPEFGGIPEAPVSVGVLLPDSPSQTIYYLSYKNFGWYINTTQC